MFQSRRFWFSYRLGVEEDGDEDEEAAAAAAAMLLLRLLVVVLTAMVLMLMLMLVLSALEVSISGTESMDKCLIFGRAQAWRRGVSPY